MRHKVNKEEGWTKEQYLNWLTTRGEAGTWGLEACHKADRLIRETTLANFNKQAERVVAANQAMEPFIQLARDMVQAHFGSVEVDQALMNLGCYPDWMER